MSGQRPRRRFHAIYLLPVLIWGGLIAERLHLRAIYEDSGSERIDQVVHARRELSEYRRWNPLREWTSERYLLAIDQRLGTQLSRLTDRLIADVEQSIEDEDDRWQYLARDCRFLMTVPGRPAKRARELHDALFESVVEDRLLEAVGAGRIEDPRDGFRLCERVLQSFSVHHDQRQLLSDLQDRYRQQWDYRDCHELARYRAENPDDVDGLVERLRQYLRYHPRGHFGTSARHFISWSRRLRGYRPYAVQLEELRLNEKAISNIDGAPEVYVSIQSGRRSTQCAPLPSGYRFRGVQHFEHGLRWRRGESIRIEVWDSDQLQDDQLFEIRLHGDLALDQLNEKVAHRSGHTLRFRTSLEVPSFPPVPDLHPVTLDTSGRR